MNLNRLRPEIRNVIRWLPRIPWASPGLLPLSRLVYNIGARTQLGQGIKTSREYTDGLEMLVYAPKEKRAKGAILWIFGGGHLAGKPAHLNAIASKAVHEIGVEVIVPKYRLAPKHPFPADIDDCFKAWNWLTANAEKRGIHLDKLAIAGNSAGAGIAAALAQRILDHGGIQPQAQCLFYPMMDDRVAADRSLDKINHFIWNNKANYFAWDTYLGAYKPGSDNLPEYAAAARRENLAGLAAAWIGQCELDLFANEYSIYARRLEEAGVACEVCRVEGVPHAFELLIPKSKVAIEFEASAMAFLKNALD